MSEQTFPFGYLCEVPFLQEVSPAVQLDLLASTWQKHLSREEHLATLVEESVIYSACETTSRLIDKDPESVIRYLGGGPIDLTFPIDANLAKELRLLYLELPNDGDFLLVNQFLDFDPEESNEQKIQMGVDPAKLEPLFDVLGRWNASPDMTANLKGLLTNAECARVATMLRIPCLT